MRKVLEHHRKKKMDEFLRETQRTEEGKTGSPGVVLGVNKQSNRALFFSLLG